MNTPTITVTVGMKIQPKQYESAEAHITINDLPVGATKEEIGALLDTGRVAYELMRDRLAVKIRELRSEGGK